MHKCKCKCVFEWCKHARAFTSSLSEKIRKIIWILFSAINIINSALHLTHTCNASSFGLLLAVLLTHFSNKWMIVITLICLSCFSLHCTEITMFRFRCRSGIRDYKNICNATLSLNFLFFCIFRSIAFNIRYKMGRFRIGGRLRGLKIEIAYW